MRGQRFRHETDLNEWLDSGCVQSVEDAIDDRPIVFEFP